MTIQNILQKQLYLLCFISTAHAMRQVSPLLPRGQATSDQQEETKEYHYRHSATQDAQLLFDLINGPSADAHPFAHAGFIIASSNRDDYDHKVADSFGDQLSASMADFARTDILGVPELKNVDTQIKVRQVLAHLKEHGKLALICVHGTFSKDIGFGDNLEKQSTHNILDFAKKLGVSYNKAVSIISFVWSGQLDIEARKKAGADLAAYIMDTNEYDQLWTIAHSHGCNVVNHAAYQMLEQGYLKNIDVAIHLASPVPDLQTTPAEGLTQATPETFFNIKKLLHFYGSHDVSGLMGTLLSSWQVGRKTRPGTDSICAAYNIRTQLNGLQLDHLNIKQVLAHLPGLLHAIDTYYTCFFDLDANLNSTAGGKSEYPMVTIRKWSKEPQHAALRANARRGKLYSDEQEARFALLRNGDIHAKSSIFWRMVAAPWQEYWGKSTHDSNQSPTDQ